MASEFRELEKLVAKIQQQLAPNSEIVHNTKLPGHRSRTLRQIDVLVKDQIGQYQILIVIECKDYKQPVDVKGVEEFWGLFEDVRAHKGVLVCPKGFTKAAKARAQYLQIDLYSPIDTDLHKWTARATIPAICDFRSAIISFYLSSSAPFPFRTDLDFYRTQQIYDKGDDPLGTALENAIKKWNSGRFSTDVGKYEDLPIFDELEMRMENGYGMIIPVDIGVTLEVSQKLYYGQFPILKISGFKDEITGNVIANAFDVGILDSVTVQKEWRVLKDVSEAPVHPVIRLRGLVGWAKE